MANDYYRPSGVPRPSAEGSSSDMRAEFAALERAFDKFPNPSYAGTLGFSDALLVTPQLEEGTFNGGEVGTTDRPTKGAMTRLRFPQTAVSPTDAGAANEIQLGTDTAGDFHIFGATKKAASVTLAGDFVVRGGELMATSDTSGFLRIPIMNGAPAATPTNEGDCAALVLDVTNGRLYVHDGSAWLFAAVT